MSWDNVGIQRTKSVEEKFWEKVDVLGEGDCWNWQATTYPSGYGSFRFNGIQTGAMGISMNKIIIEMDVTNAQALALVAMFHYWERLSNMGASRFVAFYVDGDGDFHPKIQIHTKRVLPDLLDEAKKICIVEDDNGHRKYDYDPIDWRLDE